MGRRLNPDQLGKKGEAQFQELCTDAGLIANPSTWDRKGWDFVVDWPMADSGPLDSRPTPSSCLVQVKTVWSGAKSVRLRLSSIEHLAKDLKPAFIHALEVDDALRFVGARSAHLAGDLLALVLKALRQATVDGAAPNGVSISLGLDRWFTGIETTGDAARQAFEGGIGPSMAGYAARKQSQLGSLGFGDDRMTMTTTFEVDDEEHVLDAFLGLRKLDVVSGAATERRFGIELPMPGMDSLDGGELTILPKAHDTCELIATDPATGREFRFRGDMFGVPSIVLPEGRVKLMIRSALFDLLINGRRVAGGDPDLKMTLNMDAERVRKAKVRASDWRDLNVFLAALGRNGIGLTIKASQAEVPMTGSVTTSIDPATVRRWDEVGRIAAIADDMLERAGWPATKLSIASLGEAADALDLLDAMVRHPETVSPISFSTSPGANGTAITGGGPIASLYVDVVDLGPHMLVYAVSLDLVPSIDGERIHWTGANYRFRDIARVKPTKAAHDRFIADVRRRTGISTFFARGTAKDAETLIIPAPTPAARNDARSRSPRSALRDCRHSTKGRCARCAPGR